MSEPASASPAPAEPHRRAGSSFAAQLASLGATVLNRVFLLGVLLRVWGPEQLSEWVVASSVVVFIGLPDAWMQVQFGNLFHASHAAARRDEVNRWVGIAITCYASAYGLLVAVALALLAWTDLASLILVPGRDAQHLTCLLALLVVDRGIVSLRGAVVHLYRADGELTRLVNSSTLLSLASTVGIIAVVMFGASDLIAASVLIVIDTVLGLVVLAMDLVRRMPWLDFRPALPHAAELRQLSRNICWYAIDHTGLVVINDLPVIFLAAMNVSPVFIVFFTMARTIANFVRQMQMAAANSMAFELVDRSFRAGARIPVDIVVRCADALALGSAILAAAAAAQSTALLTLWAGKSPQIDTAIFFPLYVAVAAAAPMAISSLTLSYTNKPSANAITRLVQMVILALAAVSLTKVAPFAGTVLAIGLAELVAQAIVLPMLLRGTDIALPFSGYSRILGRQVLAFSLMCAAGLLVRSSFPPEGWAAAIFGGVITTAVACAGISAVINREDRRRILELFSSVARRLRRSLHP